MINFLKNSRKKDLLFQTAQNMSCSDFAREMSFGAVGTSKLAWEGTIKCTNVLRVEDELLSLLGSKGQWWGDRLVARTKLFGMGAVEIFFDYDLLNGFYYLKWETLNGGSCSSTSLWWQGLIHLFDDLLLAEVLGCNSEKKMWKNLRINVKTNWRNNP